MSFFGLDKWAFLLKIVHQNGGPFKSLNKLWRFDTLKSGVLVGCDCFGNKYYENDYYMIGRNRWVEHNPAVGWDYDASQVTPDWYGWLHHKTDRTPCQDCAKLCLICCPTYRCWLQPHEENLTGSDKAYYPYSTTRPHIYVWDGGNTDARVCYEL